MRNLLRALLPRKCPKCPHRAFRPALEALEDRLAPSVVTTLADGNAPGTLRYCAGQPGAVTFASGLKGVINLTLGTEIAITKATSITGNGLVTVNGLNSTRIFHVLSGTSVTISDLTLTNGFARVPASTGKGGAILDEGNLTLQSDVFNYNRAFLSGGAVEVTAATSASLTVAGCTFTANRAITGFGGAISTNDFRQQSGNLGVGVSGSTFAYNVAAQGGGAIDFDPSAAFFGVATLTVATSTFRGNQAADGGGLYCRDNAVGGAEHLTLGGNSFDGNGANGVLTGQGSSGHGGAVALTMNLSGKATADALILGGDFTGGHTTGFTGNWANWGGAISTVISTSGNSRAAVHIEQVEVSSNQAVWGGGIYTSLNGQSTGVPGESAYATTITLMHSTVDDNVATSLPAGASVVNGEGGGIWARVSGNAKTLLDCVNDTVAWNSAVTSTPLSSTGNGGGIYLTGNNLRQGPVVSLNSLTVAYNSAVNKGGGLYVDNPFIAIFLAPLMRNCAFCSNTAPIGPDGWAVVHSTGFNLVCNLSGFLGVTNPTDTSLPCNLSPVLADNGGPTLTLLPLPGSPLRGTSWASPGGQFDDPHDDQRYFARKSPTSRGAVDPGGNGIRPGHGMEHSSYLVTSPADAAVVALLTDQQRHRR
jgi:predicted outer membrane repeat protein